MTEPWRIRRPRRGSQGLWTWCLLAGILLSLVTPVLSQQLRFEEFRANYPAFSPNDPPDGVQDSLAIYVRLNLPGLLSVSVYSDTLVRALLDTTSVGTDLQIVFWDGKPGPNPEDVPVEGDYGIRVIAWGAEEFAVDSLDVELDLTDPTHASTVIAEGDSLVRDGDTITIDTIWDREGYAIEPNFTRIDSDTLGGLQKIPMGDTTRLIYTLSFSNTREDADGIRIPIHATDLAGNSAVDSTLMLNLHNTPIPLGSAPLDSVRTVHDGQTVVILSQWDREELGLTADFSNVDNGTSSPPAAADIGEGLYRITYTISEDNTVPDGDSLAVPITATTRFGDSFTDASLYLCLSNDPPVHLGTRLQNDRSVFKNGDEIRIETQWRSPAGLLIADARGDFGDLSSVFDLGEDRSERSNDTTFVVEYKIPSANETSDNDSILIPVYGQDAGCGRTWARVLWVALDNTPPDEIPVLDPLPTSTTNAEITVSGLVAAQPGAAVYRVGDPDDDLLATTETDASGRFTASVTLIPGPQEIVARSLDLPGNESEPSAAQRIVLVEGARIDIPKPFRTNNVIVATHPNGWEKLEIRLLNLEGGLVREWSLPGAGRYVEIPWDGRNDSGERVHSGPFLLIWEGSISGGGREEKKLPLLYLR